MNMPNDYLHDLELPHTGLAAIYTNPVWLIILTVLIVLVMVLAIIGYHYQRQQPLATAKRQLHLLSTTQPDPQALAALLRHGLQVQRLKDSALPKDFLQRLDTARFSAQPCSTALFTRLKTEASRFLE